MLAMALMSCSSEPPAVAIVSPSPAQSQATDLRTQLGLLLTEHVMVVMKASAAAANRSEGYGAYTVLLAINAADLTRLLARAIGNTATLEVISAWNQHNANLVDYSIAAATHDDEKSRAAKSRLNGESGPRLASIIAGVIARPADQINALVLGEAGDLMSAIDAYSAQKYADVYSKLDHALATATETAAALSLSVISRFPDKFPGDVTASSAKRRVLLNVLLQERAYLMTMATDAQVNKRSDERQQALAGVSKNLDAASAVLNDASRQAWSDEILALVVYAGGDDGSLSALSETLVPRLKAATGAPGSVIADQVDATIRVIDDQRAKSLKTLAGDDRSAAAAMQPIADSL